MRLRIYAIFFAGALFASAAHAAGNVLLPADNGSGAGPNLGITPSAPAVTAPGPDEAPAPPAPQPAAAQSLPNSQPASPAPVPSPPLETDTGTLTKPDPEALKKLPPGTIPTQIIRQPDPSQMLAQANASLPYMFTVSLSGQSVFGARDVQAIGAKLGLNRDQIGSSCILSLQGLMQTSKGGYPLDSGLSPRASMHYDGIIQGYLLSARALCAAGGALPPGSGFITQIGNRLAVPLQQINCPAPGRQSPALIVTYDGSGKSQCAYQ